MHNIDQIWPPGPPSITESRLIFQPQSIPSRIVRILDHLHLAT